ncbi:DUF3822 family protein [Algibacter sp. 2305UL17-15]|uniref:DUF3822 family protein n=1 Tax=Algibacter sp. 2305UL17-15 TaxID=3231268 RepID=UPI0034596671
MAPNNKNLKILSNKKLSIQISLSGLSFCILQSDTNTITALKEFKFDKKINPFEALDHLKHLFSTEKQLQTNFDAVLIIHENELSTLVPMALFNKDYLADYLKFNSKILQSDFISHDVIHNNESVNVYVPYVNINNFIYEKFGEFTFKHFSTLLLENILEKADNGKMYVHVADKHFEIIIISNGKLALYNTFEYKNEKDFIYYILFAAEQLNLNPETLNLVLLGAINEDDELYKIAYQYIRNINFGSRNDTYKYTETPTTNHSHYTLIQSF